MTAKEMFEDLGFMLVSSKEDNFIQYRKAKEGVTTVLGTQAYDSVVFVKTIKRWDSSITSFDKLVTNAIVKQLEELGWLDGKMHSDIGFYNSERHR